MVSETKTTIVKAKPNNHQDGVSTKGKVDLSVTKKKIDNSVKRAVDLKNKSGSTVVRSEVKGKTITSSSKITTTKTSVREKKVFTLPGQKYDPPEEREPLRIFYESLSKQIPSSEMAEFWMMEHGLLSPEKAKKAHEKKQRRQKQVRMGTPIKSPPPPPRNKPESSQKHQQQASKNDDIKPKKRVIKYEDDDDDEFIQSPKKRKW